jgi:excisionase family DNA binding protein
MGEKKLEHFDDDDLLDSKKICKKLGISMRTLRRMTENDELPTTKIRGRIKARKATLDQWIARRETKVK